VPIKSQIVYKGENFESVSDLARYLKMKPSTLHTRIAKGLPQDQWDMKSFSKSHAMGKEIIYKKKKYSSIRSLSKVIGISESALRKKIKNGRPEEEWNIRDNAKEVIYMGKKYSSISLLAKEINVNQATLNKNINDGLPQEEWAKINNGEQIIYKGIEYGSIQDLADYLDMNYATLYARIKKGLPEEEWAKDNQIEINYQNKSFKSIISFAKFLGIPGRTHKLSKLLKKEKDINIVVKKALIHEKETIYFYKGKRFKSLKSLAESQGIFTRLGKLQNLLKEGLNIEDAIEKAKINDKNKNIEFDGKIFKTYKDLAAYLKIETSTLIMRINKGVPKKNWGDALISYEIKYKGKIYQSANQLAKKLNIPAGTLRRRIKDKWPEKRWGEKPGTLYQIIFKGESYKSINHLAKSFNFPPKLLKGRIEKGWSEDRWFERDNRIVIFQGKEYPTINALAKELDIPLKTLKGRREQGWPEDRWGEKKHNHEITYKGKVYESINVLAQELGVVSGTLAQRIREGWPEEKWGEVGGGAYISTGYTWEEAPKHLKEAAEKLALGLNISPVESYKILLEKLFKEKKK